MQAAAGNGAWWVSEKTRPTTTTTTTMMKTMKTMMMVIIIIIIIIGDTQLRLENDHPGVMAGKDHTVAKKQGRRTSKGTSEGRRTRKFNAKKSGWEEKGRGERNPLYLSLSTKPAMGEARTHGAPRNQEILQCWAKAAVVLKDFSPSIFAQMPNLWAAWACGNPDRMRTTTRLLSCSRLCWAFEQQTIVLQKKKIPPSLWIPSPPSLYFHLISHSHCLTLTLTVSLSFSLFLSSW